MKDDNGIVTYAVDAALQHYIVTHDRYDTIKKWHVTTVAEFEQPISYADFSQCFKNFVLSEPLLYSALRYEQGKWVVHIDQALQLNLQYIELDNLEQLQQLVETVNNTALDVLGNVCPLRANYVKIDEKSYLLLQISHLVADGFSWLIIKEKMSDFVRTIHCDIQPKGPDNKMYMLDIYQSIYANYNNENVAWWRDKLLDHKQISQFDGVYVEGPVINYIGYLDAEDGERLKNFCSLNKYSPPLIFLYSYLIALYEVLGITDPIVSIVDMHRDVFTLDKVANLADWTPIRPWPNFWATDNLLAELRQEIKNTKTRYIPFWCLMRELNEKLFYHPYAVSPYQFNFLPPGVDQATQANGVFKPVKGMSLSDNLACFDVICKITSSADSSYMIDLPVNANVINAETANLILSRILENLQKVTLGQAVGPFALAESRN